jgi:hypothetical protein
MSILNSLSLKFDEYQLEQIHSALMVLNSAYCFNTPMELASYIDAETSSDQKKSGCGYWATLGFQATLFPGYEDDRPRVSLTLHTCIVSEILKLANK